MEMSREDQRVRLLQEESEQSAQRETRINVELSEDEEEEEDELPLTVDITSLVRTASYNPNQLQQQLSVLASTQRINAIANNAPVDDFVSRDNSL